jgi:hypothetical protein
MAHLRQVLTGLIYAGLIKENSERSVGVATLLDNGGQGGTQTGVPCAMAGWDMSHVVSRTSNLISQYLQAPESSSIFKLIILQHDLGRSNLPLNGNWRVTLSDPQCSKQPPRCHQARSQRSVCKHVIV